MDDRRECTTQIRDEVEIGRIHRSPKVAIVGRLVKVNGDPRADLRQFIIQADHEIPTRVGINLPVAMLPQRHELVGKMVEASENTTTAG